MHIIQAILFHPENPDLDNIPQTFCSETPVFCREWENTKSEPMKMQRFASLPHRFLLSIFIKICPIMDSHCSKMNMAMQAISSNSGNLGLL